MIPNKKILFLHVPKTGGTSIIKLLEKNNISLLKYDNIRGLNKHSTLQELYDFGFEETYNISIVRNPFDRLISFYNFFGVKEYSKLSFDEYINKIEDFHMWIRPAYQFFTLNGEYSLDVLMKLENLNEDVKKLCDEFSLEDREVEVLNTAHTIEHFTYTEKQKQKVYDVFYQDFKYFNYS